MKRRLFLKSSTVGVGGVIVLPALFYGCQDPKPLAFDGIGLFMESAELFDSGIAELRLAGSGALASAESEDPDLAGIAEQIMNGVAVPAELDTNFAESSVVVLGAAESLYLSGPEMFAEDAFTGAEAELAEDYAFLKVLKASTLLSSAAGATPLPRRKVIAAENMVASATMVHESIDTGAEAEMIESSEHLLAYTEEYVGAAETFSARNHFITGVHSYAEAAENYAENNQLNGGDMLMTSSDNISLSAGYYSEGLDTLNAEAEIFNAALSNSAEELVPFSKHLYSEAKIYTDLAKGLPAENGAIEMLNGAEMIELDAESNATNLLAGGEMLDTGADNFITGTMTFNAAEDYTGLAGYFLESSESLEQSPYFASQAEAEIVYTSEMLFPASENFQAGSEALLQLENMDGIESLVPAATELLSAAEFLSSIANSAEAEIGAAEIVEGAEMAEAGAIESFENPGELIPIGTESIELGSFSIMNGAAEFVHGYTTNSTIKLETTVKPKPKSKPKKVEMEFDSNTVLKDTIPR